MVTDPLLDEHQQTWNNFLKLTWGSVAVSVVVLTLLALFVAPFNFLG